MATKINTLKQLRKGNDGTFLGNKDNQLKWLTIAELGVKDAAAITEEINNAIEAAKNQLKVEINTAKFVGPVASEAGQEGNIDTNDLLLVGNAAPYKIFAKVGGALVEVGKTDVDLSNYHTKQEIAEITAGIAQAATQEITQAKQEAIAAAEQDATTKANQAKQEAKNETLSEVSRDYVSKDEANGKELEAQRQIEAAKQEAIIAAAQEAAQTAGEDATRKAEQAKQEAITAAAQDATTKADGVKNELDPRITALENKAYKLKSFYVRRTPEAAPAKTELTITLPGVNKPVDSEILSSLSIYLNGVFQNRTDDLWNLFAGRTDGTIVVSFFENLDDQDVVYVTGHYIGEA